MSDYGKPGSGIGARLKRKEDARHLMGRASFVGDIAMPGLVEVAFLRSPLAHARIKRVAVPTELAGSAFTAADLSGVKPMQANNSIPGFKSSDFPALATGKVRFAGEPLAFCLGPTRAVAEDRCQALGLELEELPAVIDALAARKPGSALVHEPWGDNLFLVTSADARFEELSSKAEVVVKREYKLARQCMAPMEGKGVLAYWDDRADQLVVYTSTQVPHIIRTGLALHLGLDQGRVRVIAPDVGGGFGYKCILQPEELCVAWLALTRRQPARWTEDRREHLVAAANAREHHYLISAYADRRGRLLALEAEVTVDVGAYSVWPFSAGLEAAQAGGNLPGPYDFFGYRCRTYSVATNKPPFVPYRGVARPGVCYAIELTIDAIARAVGREPAEVRRENLVPASAMPYDNVTKKHYDSGDYQKGLDIAVEKIGLAAVRARQKTSEPDGRLIGIGFSSYTEQTAHGTKVFASWGIPLVPGFEQATVRLTPDGGLEVRVGVQSHGQGMETTLAQIAHEILGIDPAAIKVVHGDTALTPYSTGTYASRSIVMAGGAVSRSSQTLGERIKRIAAHLLQGRAEEMRLEQGEVHGPRGHVSLAEVARVWYLRP